MGAIWDRIDAELDRRGWSWSDLGRRIQATDQRMHNWKSRGVPASQHRAIAQALGWSVERLVGDDPAIGTPPSGGMAFHPVAQDLSLPVLDDELPTHSWEFVLSAGLPLPKRFCVAVPDDALAPRSPRGTEFVFSSTFTGQPDDSVAVIVQTAGGRRYMRLFFALDGGAWEARARDAAVPVLHSERDGLQLLAVAVFRPGGQA